MTEMFKQDIARTIGKVLKDNGYRKIPVYKDCVYFIKRYSQDLAFYVRCRDCRSNNRGVSVEIFFVPVEIPADNVIDSPAGLNVKILTIYDDELSDEILTAAGEKVVAVEKKLGNCADMVMEELKNPYLKNKKWEIHTKILLIYKTLNEDPKIKKQIEEFMIKWCNSSHKDKPSSSELVHEIVDNLPDDYFEKFDVDLSIGRIIDKLSMHIDAHCELDNKRR